MRKGGRKGDGR